MSDEKPKVLVIDAGPGAMSEMIDVILRHTRDKQPVLVVPSCKPPELREPKVEPESEPITPEELAGMRRWFRGHAGSMRVERLIGEIERLRGENDGLHSAVDSLQDSVYALSDALQERER